MGESASADVGTVVPFKERLKKTVVDNDTKTYEIYNADETRLVCKSLPKNSHNK